jgi:hypothetical protein
MKKWINIGILTVLIIGMVFLSGCIDDAGSSEPVITQTPQIVYVTVLVTPTPTPPQTPTPPLDAEVMQTTTPVSTISPTCNNLGSSVKDDLSFFESVDNNDVISRTYLLIYDDDCDLTAGSQINQDIVNGAKPKTLSLVQARKSLMSANTLCIEPNSASKSRAKDDMEGFGNKLKEYTDEVNSCPNLIDEDLSVLSKVSQEYEGTALFSGYGSKVSSFTVTGTGLRMFTMKFSGSKYSNNFIVKLKDENGNYIDLLANEIGFYSGKKSTVLTSGTYYLDVSTTGLWTITMTTV